MRAYGRYPADPLIRMALIHHQFESIHPFYDGNGRTGRIVNVLYLLKEGLLDTPVLYMSRYIVRTKAEYYRLLQDVRERGAWEDWVLYMLTAVEETARDGIATIGAIRETLQFLHQRRSLRDPRWRRHARRRCAMMRHLDGSVARPTPGPRAQLPERRSLFAAFNAATL